MKKSVRTIFVAMMVTLMVAFAGQAMAYFEQESLVRVVWERRSPATPSGTYEVVTDLGKGNWTFSEPYAGPNVMISSPQFSLSQLELSNWDHVYVAYYISKQSTVDVWVSGNTSGVQRSAARQMQNFYSNSGQMLGYNYLTGQPQNRNLQEIIDSFARRFTNYGHFNGFLATGHVGHASLSSFNQEGIQYVDQYLYFYDTPNSAANGVPILVLRTWETGMTEILPIPIPPAAILLGTGLLGLIGIRRRMKDDVLKG